MDFTKFLSHPVVVLPETAKLIESLKNDIPIVESGTPEAHVFDSIRYALEGFGGTNE